MKAQQRETIARSVSEHGMRRNRPTLQPIHDTPLSRIQKGNREHKPPCTAGESQSSPQEPCLTTLVAGPGYIIHVGPKNTKYLPPTTPGVPLVYINLFNHKHGYFNGSSWILKTPKNAYHALPEGALEKLGLRFTFRHHLMALMCKDHTALFYVGGVPVATALRNRASRLSHQEVNIILRNIKCDYNRISPLFPTNPEIVRSESIQDTSAYAIGIGNVPVTYRSPTVWSDSIPLSLQAKIIP